MSISPLRGHGNDSWNIPENYGVDEDNEEDRPRGGVRGSDQQYDSESIKKLEKDVLLCTAVLRSSMVDQKEELEVVERKLLAMMMQRVFMPGELI